MSQQYTLSGEPLKIYCFDTSVFVELWRVTHRPRTFPSLWKDIENLIKAKKIISSEEVLEELHKRDDGLYKWALQNRDGFLPINRAQIDELKKIHEELNDYGHRGRSLDADPWILVVGRMRRGYVVSAEKSTGDRNNPRIPDACKLLNIPHLQASDVFEMEDLSY